MFSNFVPNKIIAINERDPPWMSKFINSKIHWCNRIYKKIHESFRIAAEYDILQQAIAEVSEIIYKKKIDNYSLLTKKLSDSATSSKSCWSILKTFYDGKKIPLTPPLLRENVIEANFLKKLIFSIRFLLINVHPQETIAPYMVHLI